MIIVWRVTQHCNLACPFCAYDRRLPGPRTSIDADRVLRFADGQIVEETVNITKKNPSEVTW